MRIEDLIEQAESLPVDERLLLVEALLRKLNSADPTIDSAWIELAVRRLEELNSGAAVAIPGEVVLNKLMVRFLDVPRIS